MAKTILLGAWDLKSAFTESKRTELDIDSGAIALTLEFEFQYGSGGSSCHAVVQAGFADDDGDGRIVWRDVARANFAQASRVAHCNVQGYLLKNVGTYAALAAEGVNHGVISNLLRVVAASSTPYSNSTLSVRAAVRSPLTE